MRKERVTKTVVSLGLIFLKFDEEIILLILFFIYGAARFIARRNLKF